MPLDGETNVEYCERFHVWSVERVNFVAAFLSCPVAPKNLVIEIDNYFRYLERACNHERTKQIVHSITSELSYGNLRTRNDHGLLEVLKHEAESRGSVRHRVCPMAHNEAVIVIVVLLNRFGNPNLVSNLYVA